MATLCLNILNAIRKFAWYRGSGSIMLRKAIWEKFFAKVAKILLLSQKYSKTNNSVVEKPFDFFLCLFGFEKLRRFRDSSEFSDCVQNV